MKPTLILQTLPFFSLLLAACNGGQSGQSIGCSHWTTDNGSWRHTDISVAELQTMLNEKDFAFINTHIPFEGDIPGTDLTVPFDQIEENLDKLPEDKDAKIVLYCRSDRMSGIASETLVALGYTNIWNLDGGMVAWENAGFALEGK